MTEKERVKPVGLVGKVGQVRREKLRLLPTRPVSALSEKLAKQSLIKILIFNDGGGSNVDDARHYAFDGGHGGIAAAVRLGGEHGAREKDEEEGQGYAAGFERVHSRAYFIAGGRSKQPRRGSAEVKATLDRR